MTTKEEFVGNCTISTIICTYRSDRYKDVIEAIRSLIGQSYRNLKIIVVVDGNMELYDKILKSSEIDKLDTRVILNEENLGLSESRNKGIKQTEKGIITFLDDDAVADKNWISELKRMYDEENAIAAGGKLIPLWIVPKPNFLPEEYYWLIGATHKGFQTKMCEVRNTFGSNISFKKEILVDLNGFKSDMGFKGGKLLQGEETELCDRMKKMHGRGVMYNPNAVVYHKVFPERIEYIKLMKRCFWQGYSKRIMKEQGHEIKEESDYLKYIITGVKERVLHPTLTNWIQVISLVLFTFSVAIGYGYKSIRMRS